MNEIQSGRREHDDEDLAAIIAVLKANNEALSRIARASFMSRERVVTLAIQYFGSLPLKEQWGLVKKHLTL